LKKKILVSVDAGETRVAVLEAKGSARAGRQTKDDEGGGQQKRRSGDDNWRVGELYVERRGSRSIVGNIYKGVVDNVLPGMEAAFVDIGLERNGFLHVDEIVTPDGKAVPKRGRGQGRRIDELIKRGQEIVVQVVKDPLKTKGARMSMRLSIGAKSGSLFALIRFLPVCGSHRTRLPRGWRMRSGCRPAPSDPCDRGPTATRGRRSAPVR